MIQVEGIFSGGGGGAPNLQSKSVTYTENGSATVTPDAGYDGLSSVDVTVNVSGGGAAEPKVACIGTETNFPGMQCVVELEIDSYFFEIPLDGSYSSSEPFELQDEYPISAVVNGLKIRFSPDAAPAIEAFGDKIRTSYVYSENNDYGQPMLIVKLVDE